MQAAAAGSTAASLFAPSFPAAGSGGTQDLTGTGDTGLYVMGTGIQINAAGSVTAVLFYAPTTLPTNGDFSVGLWLADPVDGINSNATLLISQTGTLPSATGWTTYTLSTPQAVTSGQTVYPVVRTNRYAISSQVFAASVTNGSLVGRQDTGTSTAYPNGAFADSGADTNPLLAPVKSFGAAFYGVDLAFVAS